MNIFPVRFYDIYVYTTLWYFIVDVIFFLLLFVIFFLTTESGYYYYYYYAKSYSQNIWNWFVRFRFGMLHKYIYHVLLFYHFYHERWSLVRRWRHAIAASEWSKYTGVHTTKNQIKQFHVLYNIKNLYTLRWRVFRSRILFNIFIR